MQDTTWNALEVAYIEMEETGKRCIITLPEIIKEVQGRDGLYQLRVCEGGDYFVYGLNLDGEGQIELLNMKEQLFGDFKEEIRYDNYADTLTVAEEADEEWMDTEHFQQVVNAILDRSNWVPCHFVEIHYGDEKETDRMYLCRVGEHPQLNRNEVETGRFLQYDVNKQEFVYVD